MNRKHVLGLHLMCYKPNTTLVLYPTKRGSKRGPCEHPTPCEDKTHLTRTVTTVHPTILSFYHSSETGYSSKIHRKGRTREFFLNRPMLSLVPVIFQSVTHISAFTMSLVMSHLCSDGYKESKPRVKSSELGRHKNIPNNQDVYFREFIFFCFFLTLGHSSLES